jgi:hypothetical protein
LSVVWATALDAPLWNRKDTLMKLSKRISSVAAASILVVGLAGCASGPAKSGDHSHAAMGSMDMQSHCEMHKKMMAGRSSMEQQAMMQEHMKSMPSEMHQRMQTMHEQCK